jgi:hypothetical protein
MWASIPQTRRAMIHNVHKTAERIEPVESKKIKEKKTLKKCIEYKRQQHNDDEGKNPKTSWPEYYIV